MGKRRGPGVVQEDGPLTPVADFSGLLYPQRILFTSYLKLSYLKLLDRECDEI